MINTLAKLAQKPSDKTIRITRTIFALILIAIIYFGWSVTGVNFGLPKEIEYAFYLFPAIGLIRGALDPGVVRKGIWKWIIVGFGSVMLLTSLILIDDVVVPTISPTVSQSSSGVSLSDLVAQGTTTNTPFTLSTDNWFGFFGVILIIIGLLLNGKNITMKNERYGEVIKKIRV